MFSVISVLLVCLCTYLRQLDVNSLPSPRAPQHSMRACTFSSYSVQAILIEYSSITPISPSNDSVQATTQSICWEKNFVDHSLPLWRPCTATMPPLWRPFAATRRCCGSSVPLATRRRCGSRVPPLTTTATRRCCGSRLPLTTTFTTIPRRTRSIRPWRPLTTTFTTIARRTSSRPPWRRCCGRCLTVIGSPLNDLG